MNYLSLKYCVTFLYFVNYFSVNLCIILIILILLPSEAIHQRVLKCDIPDIANHSTDIYLSVLGR